MLLITVKVQLFILATYIRQWWVSEKKPGMFDFCKTNEQFERIRKKYFDKF